MLETRFPRLHGDIGNPASFVYPVRYRVIPNASPGSVVRRDPAPLLADFLAAARELEREGAAFIATSCGFLTPFQAALREAVEIPVLASALFLHRGIERRLPAGKRCGILTITAASLSAEHLQAAGIPADTPVGSPENHGHFTEAILRNESDFDPVKAEAEHVEAATALAAAHPELAAILLECTNMPPYAAAIGAATGLPVHSILDGMNALWVETAQTAAGRGIRLSR